jgi:COP9 signalosome complex subunit 1
MHIPGRLLSFPATNDPRLLAFARTALVRAIPRVKETWDHGLYLRCVSQINETLGQPATSIPRGADSDDEGDDDEPMSGEANEAEGKPDMAWVKRVKEEEKKEITKTDVELRGYMSNLIKESIRVSSSAAIRPVVCEPDGEVTYLALAQMHNKRGDPVAANRSYAAAREFSVGGVQLLEQGLGQIEVCLIIDCPKIKLIIRRALCSTHSTV